MKNFVHTGLVVSAVPPGPKVGVCARMRMRVGVGVRVSVGRKYLFRIKIIKKLSGPLEATSRKWVADSPHILRSVTGDGLEYNLKTCIPDRLANP